MPIINIFPCHWSSLNTSFFNDCVNTVGFLKVAGCVRPVLYIPGARLTIPHSGLLPSPEQCKCVPGSLRPRQSWAQWDRQQPWLAALGQADTAPVLPKPSWQFPHLWRGSSYLSPRSLVRIKWSPWSPETHNYAGQAILQFGYFISKPAFYTLWQGSLISDDCWNHLGISQICWCSHPETFRFGVPSATWAKLPGDSNMQQNLETTAP